MKAATVENPPPVNAEMTMPSPARVEAVPANTAIWNVSPWKWFFSLGLGVVILLILIVASTIGTLIDPLARAQALIFYTWWYKLLLLALAVIMTCATIKTIMLKLLPTRELRLRTQKHFFDSAPLSTRIPFDGEVQDVARAFKRSGFKVRYEDKAGAARTGWWGRFGAPVSHAGMVIVLLAGFASSWVAQEGIVQIPEGRSSNTMQMANDLEKIVPLGYTLSVDDFSTGFFPRTRIPSHYTSTVTARDGHQVLYSGPVEVNHSPKIKGWRLHQTSYQELPTLPRYEVEIASASLSSPVKAEISPGQTITLATKEPMQLSVDNRMNWALLKGSERVASGALGSAATQGVELSLLANRFEPDFVLGEDRQITSRSQELSNPALHVTLLRDGSPSFSQWLFGREDMRAFSHAPSGDVRMELLDVQRGEDGDAFVVAVTDSNSGVVIARALLQMSEEQVISTDPHAECPDCEAAVAARNSEWSVTLGKSVTAYATVLTLSRNPAIPTIYFGCLLMTLGLMMAFFVPRRDVWFLHDKEKRQLLVTANYRHLSDQFDRTTQAVLSRIARSSSTLSTGKEN